jgi:hypothetical protein
MIVLSDSPSSTPVELVFDAAGRVKWMGPWKFTWDTDRITKVAIVRADGTTGSTWEYTYGAHRELLSAVEKRGTSTKTWFTGKWTGTFGAARKTTAPLIYGTPIISTFAGYGEPFLVYEPNAVFTGTLVNTELGWKTTFDKAGTPLAPGIERTYDDRKRVVREIDTADRYRSQRDFEYDKQGRVVTMKQSFEGKLNNTTSYRYEGCKPR